MKLTPLEIKQQQFEKSLRGYDIAEVQGFLNLVSNEYEHLLNKNRELEGEIEKLMDRVKHYERVEEALHETLQTTKESVTQKMDNARLEAKHLIEKAERDAEEILQQANTQRNSIRQSIIRLLERRNEIIAGISGYLDNARNSVQAFSKDEIGIFEVPKQEEAGTLEEEDITDTVAEEAETSSTRFAFDEETEPTEEEKNKHAASGESDKDEIEGFPPGTERLNDILDEID
jgi:cell division initiation protein